MLFTFYDERLRSVPFLCVDGVVEGGLNISHWPGHRTPGHLKADTSTEMVLKLARDPGRAEWLKGVSIVTNNHFDTDGLLSVFAALRPEDALRHETAMIQAARTGDFGEWTTPEALKFDAVVTAYDDDRRSPIASEIRGADPSERHAIVYDRLLSLLPDLLTSASARKELWADRMQAYMRSMIRIRDVARIREHEAARLSVIETTEPLDEMARFNVARHHRVLTATRTPDGCVYEMAFQIRAAHASTSARSAAGSIRWSPPAAAAGASRGSTRSNRVCSGPARTGTRSRALSPWRPSSPC